MLHEVILIRSSPSFQEPPVKMKTGFFKTFLFQNMLSPEKKKHTSFFILKNVVFSAEPKNSYFSVELRLKILLDYNI